MAIVMLILLLCIPASFASAVSGNGAIEVILIESPGCPKCAAAERMLESIGAQTPLNVTGYYFYTDEGHRIIRQYGAKGAPAIIIGTQVINYRDYEGDNAKLERLIRAALANQSSRTDVLPAIALPGSKGTNQSTLLEDTLNLQDLSLYTLLAVLGAGLVAGFNPCLLGILVFLAASVLSSSGRRRELAMMVVFFSLGIFTMYFLFGIGMRSLLQTKEVFALFKNAVVVLLIVLGLAHVLDAVKLRGGGESLFRTDWALKYFQAGVDRGRLSSYFLVGALFSLVKLPCVGAVYLAILDLISAKSYLEGGIYLLFYNLGIILPIIVLGGFMALGMSPERVNAWRKDYRAGIRLFTGLMLLALAPLIYWQII